MAKTYTTWRTLQSWDSVYNADSIEFCPLVPYQHIFLCGTYQLIDTEPNTHSTDAKMTAKRKGTLMLFSINQSANSMELIRSVDTEAIADIKWSHCRVRERIVFAVANTIGQVVVYQLISPEDKPQELHIEELSSYQLKLPGEASELLALSLDWSSRNQNHTRPADPEQCGRVEDQLVVSDSEGCVHVLELTDAGLTLVRSWQGHHFQAWIAAFNYWQPTTFYSGGDDCVMKVYDTRQSDSVAIIRGHDAGVTCIQSDPFRQHTIATGSYDEHVRLWDSRNMKREQSRTRLDGGVWRIKHQPDCAMLTATMYNGFHRLSSVDHAEDLMHYHEHGDIAYGIDSCYGNPSYIVTCSFYNHLIQLSLLE